MVPYDGSSRPRLLIRAEHPYSAIGCGVFDSSPFSAFADSGGGRAALAWPCSSRSVAIPVPRRTGIQPRMRFISIAGSERRTCDRRAVEVGSVIRRR